MLVSGGGNCAENVTSFARAPVDVVCVASSLHEEDSVSC